MTLVRVCALNGLHIEYTDQICTLAFAEPSTFRAGVSAMKISSEAGRSAEQTSVPYSKNPVEIIHTVVMK